MKIDVLKVLEDENPVVPNRISGMTKINYVELMQMLSELETKGFLTVEAFGKRERPYKRLVYKTEEGAKAIRDYESLLEKLGETT
jgi:predicted transcriptional regulator